MAGQEVEVAGLEVEVDGQEEVVHISPANGSPLQSDRRSRIYGARMIAA